MGHFIKSMMFGLLLTGCALLAGCVGASNSSLIGAMSPPYTTFYMLEGEPLILEHLRGKNVVVLFWANECNQSHELINELNDYARRRASRRDLAFIAVSLDKSENLSKLKDRIQFGKLDALQHSFSGNDLYDEAKVAFGVDSLPSVFVIDPNGKVVAGGNSFGVVERALQ